MELLDNTVMPYSWGSRTFIAGLQGRDVPSATAEAELWMGAHPVAPSRVRRDGAGHSLLDLVREAPEVELGRETARRYGPRMPFLLKVLAADEPLSLQAHPSAEQAREGFARENAAGIALDAPQRTYKDASHKPELIVARGELEALCGFRAPDATADFFDALAIPELASHVAGLRRAPGPQTLRALFAAILEAGDAERSAMVRATVASCTRYRGPFEASCAWARVLADKYPSDPGVTASLLLEHVKLAPDEALYLPAGNLHAYLKGAGIEIMASSDNVLRGGLTPKHVDVPELLRVVRFDAPPSRPLAARPCADGEVTWDTPAEEFALSKISVASAPFEARTRGPEILLCVEGSVVAEGEERVALSAGAAAFVRGTEARYALTGRGVVFRASVGVARGSVPPAR